MVVVVAVVGLWSAFAAAFVFAGLVHCLALGRFAHIPYLDVVSCSQRLLELNRRLLLSGSHIVADVLGHIALLGTLLAMLIWRSYIRIIKEARLEINSSPVFDIKESKEQPGLGMEHMKRKMWPRLSFLRSSPSYIELMSLYPKQWSNPFPDPGLLSNKSCLLFLPHEVCVEHIDARGFLLRLARP